MSKQTSEALANFFKQEAGDAVRLVAHYTADSIEFVYLRDDLAENYEKSDFEDSFAIHRQDKAAAARQEETINAGSHHCTLRVYDEAIVFNFAQTGDVGTIVSMNPETGRDLLSFMTRCLKRLHEDSPQDVRPPKWVQA